MESFGTFKNLDLLFICDKQVGKKTGTVEEQMFDA